MAKRCQSWKHRVRDCKEQHRRPLKGERRQPHSFHANQQDKGKHKIIYEDGFQRVQNRKNTIMNIFENEKKEHQYTIKKKHRQQMRTLQEVYTMPKKTLVSSRNNTT